MSDADRRGTHERREAARQRAFLTPFDGLLQQLRAAHDAAIYSLYPRVEETVGPGWVSLEGRRTVSLIANDYLGLSTDPRVVEAARDAVSRLGSSRCASPLAGGYTAIHRQLEEELAEFLEQDACAVFPTGYQANLGVISALMSTGDLIVSDLLNHASIVDGARLSGAQLRYFQHNDAGHLDRILDSADAGQRALVVVEGIYSADGDIAPLADLAGVAHAHGALIMVDEAHSLGVLDERGRGAAGDQGMLGTVDLIVGTMSKSLGSVGGFAAASSAVVDVIRHNARSLIFSASLPPAQAEAARTSLAILRTEHDRRERLWENARTMLAGLEERGLDTMGSCTPVVPLLVGDPATTLALTSELKRRGVLVCPAIPPMVQAHRSRIRMHVTAAHDPQSIEHALGAIEAAATELGIVEAAVGAGSS
ncbi:MAG: aminotransferase class I/II-fold pyridoxal phosphate-dependent enzyme [Actinomycetota bacterium]|nr:aminotransferase class I/II-fold pyridoxal phosphate-dependent enzyme [Actinomycetota bacterium]